MATDDGMIPDDDYNEDDCNNCIYEPSCFNQRAVDFQGCEKWKLEGEDRSEAKNE